MEKLLRLINGKKASIVAILNLFVITLQAESLINDNWAYFLSGSLLILAGGANLATNKLYKKNVSK